MTFSEDFDPVAFLAGAGLGRKLISLKAKDAFFSQGNPADCVFYLQTGRAELTVLSESGKEATITLIAPGEFIGEESIASVPGLHLATATAVTACTALRIKREEMIRVMHEQHGFSDLFVKFLLARAMRTQADLVDRLFNSSERRLARILLLMAEFGKPWGTGDADSGHHSGDSGGDDWDHPVPRQFLYESLSRERLY
jgi:CRP-like cAMP-binding protein